jgi:hypothetical protein
VATTLLPVENLPGTRTSFPKADIFLSVSVKYYTDYLESEQMEEAQAEFTVFAKNLKLPELKLKHAFKTQQDCDCDICGAERQLLGPNPPKFFKFPPEKTQRQLLEEAMFQK